MCILTVKNVLYFHSCALHTVTNKLPYISEYRALLCFILIFEASCDVLFIMCEFDLESSAPTLGDKLQLFYLSLRDNSSKDVALKYLRCLENHESSLDDPIIVAEIVSDCRKKASQIIRSSLADDVRNLITSCRKKINMKASLDVDGTLQQNQRHLNSFVELLGCWSNMMKSLCELDLSANTYRQIVSPLHSRIIEIAYEIFEKYKEDKNLQSWQQKVRSINEEFSIITLDFILIQLASIRSIIYKYKLFYSNIINLDDELSIFENDFLKWRELDMIYIDLESAYITRATTCALEEFSLIEVEDGVYVMQMIEDSFFLLRKVIERAISTMVETAILVIATR